MSGGGTLRELLDEVRAKHGVLTPKVLVDEARDPASPLHGHFSWDVAENAEKYLLVQARELIRKVRVRYVDSRGDMSSVRAYHVVRNSTPIGPAKEYVPVEEIVADPLQKALLLRQMEREWKEFRRRWEHMSEFAGMIANGGKGIAV